MWAKSHMKRVLVISDVMVVASKPLHVSYYCSRRVVHPPVVTQDEFRDIDFDLFGTNIELQSG